MSRSTIRHCLLALACLALLACAGESDPTGAATAASDEPAGPAAQTTADVGADAGASVEGGAALSLQVETLDHGHFDLAEQRGKWVVVNYWATWCAPCLKEIPDFSAFDAAREDVVVIGLAYEEIPVDDMRAFLTEVPAGYPIAIVDVFDPPADFEPPRALPTTYLVGPDGRLAERFMGPITSEQLAEAIARIGAG